MEQNTLISEHIGLARALATKFYAHRRNSGLELDDFVSAAMLGLCEAAKSFKPRHKVKFAPYAFFRIRGSMFDLVRSAGNIPRSMLCEVSTESSRVKYRMANDLRELSALRSIIEEYGLKLVFGNEEFPEVTYSRTLNPEDATAKLEAKKLIRKLVSNLPADRKQVVSHYYFEDKTYREIEPLIGSSSKSWICRLHRAALSSLRRSIQARNVRWDLFSALSRS